MFKDNWAEVSGGGIYSFGVATIARCRFIDNQCDGAEQGVDAGGAGLHIRGQTTISNCIFRGNKLTNSRNVRRASGGGMLLSDRPEWITQAKYLATQARDPAPHYEHSTVGYNYRLSNLLAAVGRGQLRSLGDKVEARRRAS